MKKFISLILFFVLLLSVFSACAKTDKPQNDKLKIITTVFPEYDWIKNLTQGLEDNVEISMLINSGVDLHSFQPSAADLIAIEDCDLFVYIGGNSDLWIKDAIKDKDITSVNLMNVLNKNIKEEEIITGMQAEEEEDEHHDEKEYDEHIWLSIENAEIICKYLGNILCEADPSNADTYKVNTQSYIAKLDTLINSYKAVTDSAKNKTLVFADRFPFRYLLDDYSISYYAAFPGCSSESNASFETVSFLADKIDVLNLKYVLTIENSKTDIAKTVIETSKTKPQILTLDSMQSSVEKDASYISIMEKNLKVLETALS